MVFLVEFSQGTVKVWAGSESTDPISGDIVGGGEGGSGWHWEEAALNCIEPAFGGLSLQKIESPCSRELSVI